MKGYYYLTFSDLNEEAQQTMLDIAREDLDSKELRREAKYMNMDYEQLLQEKAESHIYTFNFVFNV